MQQTGVAWSVGARVAGSAGWLVAAQAQRTGIGLNWRLPRRAMSCWI
jgi:hypothetical protein